MLFQTTQRFLEHFGLERAGQLPPLPEEIDLPPGEILAPLPQRGGEGVGVTESFRGECLHWVALDDGGLVRAVFPRDPSWLQWPLLEAAIEGNIVADFPLCNKSFNCSYSGVDL
jgi:Ni,Fe-hydrogenase III large subunit